MTKSISYSLCLILVLIASGCGGDKVPLGGKVTFKEDGSPLTRGMVCFHTDSYLARGPLMPDGTYRVTSVNKNDGIPKGVYKVYIFGAEAAPEDAGASMRAARGVPLVAVKYTKPDTSGLKFEVDGKTRQFDFEVEKP